MFSLLRRSNLSTTLVKNIRVTDSLSLAVGPVPERCIKPLSLTLNNSIKTIVEKQEGKTLVVEGIISPSPREHLLVKPETDEECKACPLCRLNLDLKHTDVLILSQFVRQDGAMLPKRITGLCAVQQRRTSYLVTMAHKAGLMGKFKPKNCTLDPRKRPQWKKWNTYFDETTIKGPRKYIAIRYKKKIESFKQNYMDSGKALEA